MTDLVPLQSGGFNLEVVAPLADLAGRIARTNFVPSALRGKPEETLAAMLTGNELGIMPMQALQKIHVVEGRPTLASELMRGLILQAGHEIWIEEKTTTRVTVCGKRRGSDHVGRVTWTTDDAKRAGLAGRPNWSKYPRAMLTARATAELARDLFPDIIGGLYSREEAEDGFSFDGPVVEAEVVEEAAQTHTRAVKRKTTTASSAGRPAPSRPPVPSLPASPSVAFGGDASAVDADLAGTISADGPSVTVQSVVSDTAATTAPSAEPSSDDEPADPEMFDLIGLREQLSKAPKELQEQYKAAASSEGWGSLKEDAKNPITKGQLRAANALFLQLRLDMKATHDKRRKAANAAMSEVGIKGDKARHELVQDATDGATSSTKELTAEQLTAVINYCNQLGADGD